MPDFVVLSLVCSDFKNVYTIKDQHIFHKYVLSLISSASLFYLDLLKRRIPTNGNCKVSSPQRVIVTKISDIPACSTCVIFEEPYDTLSKTARKKRKFVPLAQPFPPSIKQITFGYYFNRPVDDFLLYLLTLLLVSFNKPVDNLPPSLTHITFDKDFDKPVDHLPLSFISFLGGILITHLIVCLILFENSE